jgi:hypothetical protein
MQRLSFLTGSAGSGAVVMTEENLTLGPYSGVRIMLFTPKVPRPAQYAACRCEKNATGLSRRTSILPYPSLGTKTDGNPFLMRNSAMI